MARGAEQHIVKARFFQDILLEHYCYAPGPAESLPKHSHEEYQICINGEPPHEYHYRGTYYHVPPGSLSVIQPGEMHSVRDLEDRRNSTTLRIMYVNPAVISMAAAEVAGHQTNFPFFADPIIHEPSLAQLALNCHVALEGVASRLEQDSLLLSMLTQFIRRYADTPPVLKPVGKERGAVQRVRNYLRENYAENVTIAHLAQVAHLSPFHLNRVFCAEVGVPPHQYQTQARVAHASRLLAQGMPIVQVAAVTGFTDQSHLTRHFKRLMRVTPGRYRWQTAKTYKK
jgi:AraC-like DNA-binding protein